MVRAPARARNMRKADVKNVDDFFDCLKIQYNPRKVLCTEQFV